MASDGDPADPLIPKAEPGDLEDVSWALSTAEASWLRGDRIESLKWLRRAAEAATEGSANVRAVVLAKAAADLTSALEKAMPPTMTAPPAPVTSPSVVATARSGAPPPSQRPPPRPGPPSQRPPPSAPSPGQRPLPPSSPAKRPSGAAPPSQRPDPPSGTRPTGPPPPLPPRRNTPSPFATAMHPSQMPAAAVRASTLTSPRGGGAMESKKGRKSSHGLEAEAKAAKDASPATHTRAASKSGRPPRPSATNEARRSRTSRPPPPTDAHPATDPDGAPADARTRVASVADEIDAWPTQSMEGAALADLTSEMSREAPEPAPRTTKSGRPPAAVTGATSQAARVLVWRTPEGLRVAPVGTAVQSPTIDAILVALDPSADLAAWLVKR